MSWGPAPNSGTMHSLVLVVSMIQRMAGNAELIDIGFLSLFSSIGRGCSILSTAKPSFCSLPLFGPDGSPKIRRGSRGVWFRPQGNEFSR